MYRAIVPTESNAPTYWQTAGQAYGRQQISKAQKLHLVPYL